MSVVWRTTLHINVNADITFQVQSTHVYKENKWIVTGLQFECTAWICTSECELRHSYVPEFNQHGHILLCFTDVLM